MLLTSFNLLIHFDPSLPIVLACDASQYGIGAVLAHKLPDGSEQPVGYVSRTLNDAERSYAQLEKEGLALVFGMKKFYSYLFGHAFTLITDHKPLLGLLSECRFTLPQARNQPRYRPFSSTVFILPADSKAATRSSTAGDSGRALKVD